MVMFQLLFLSYMHSTLYFLSCNKYSNTLLSAYILGHNKFLGPRYIQEKVSIYTHNANMSVYI